MPFLAERRLVLVSQARQILIKLNPSERENCWTSWQICRYRRVSDGD